MTPRRQLNDLTSLGRWTVTRGISATPTLPANPEIERAILGSILQDAQNCSQAESLRPDDFSLDSHRRIFTRMMAMAATGCPIDIITLQEELSRHKELEAIGGVAYLVSLTDGLARRSSIAHLAEMVREKALLRIAAREAEAIVSEACLPGADVGVVGDRCSQLAERLRLASAPTKQNPIRGFEDIPDLATLNVPPARPVIEGLLYSGSMTLLAGTDGIAKSLLAQKACLAVRAGAEFLGRPCQATPTLFLDYENPGYAVKERLDLLTGFLDEPQPLTGVKFWGTWLDQQPPQIGSDLLLQICRETKPLLVVDPLRYAHDAEENDSGEMMMVMRHLRSYASAGATVLVIHHIAKQEGSTYRGSTALRGAFDVSYLQEMNEETGLISLKCVKNRFGDKPVVYIRPDFDAGTFEVVDSPTWTKRQAEIEKLRQVITSEPGLSVNRIVEKVGGFREKVRSMLKAHCGRLWTSMPGPRKSTLYFPLGLPQLVPVSPRSPSQPIATGTVGLSLKDSPTQSHVAETQPTGTESATESAAGVVGGEL